jgi:shikimate kinase
MSKQRKKTDYPKQEHLILIGFMGSGKTSMGLRLSYRLQMPVDDTDKIIEARAGKTISEIFAEQGEGAFRRKETDLLREIASGKFSRRIISLGGGTPVQLQNQPLIRKCGTVIYLRIRPETVYERLRGDTSRPLLQCEDPLERIRKLLKERGPAYERCADLIVDVDEKKHTEVVEEIVDYLTETGYLKAEAGTGNGAEKK